MTKTIKNTEKVDDLHIRFFHYPNLKRQLEEIAKAKKLPTNSIALEAFVKFVEGVNMDKLKRKRDGLERYMYLSNQCEKFMKILILGFISVLGLIFIPSIIMRFIALPLPNPIYDAIVLGTTLTFGFFAWITLIRLTQCDLGKEKVIELVELSNIKLNDPKSVKPSREALERIKTKYGNIYYFKKGLKKHDAEFEVNDSDEIIQIGKYRLILSHEDYSKIST